MAAGDRFLYDVARKAVVQGLADPEAIRYRQAILADCLAHPDLIRGFYDLAVEAIDAERGVWGGLLNRYPETLLRRSVDVLGLFVGVLGRLRALADEHAAELGSEGLRRFTAMLSTELDDAYLATVRDHLRRLRFPSGVVMSAALGQGNRGREYVLRKPTVARKSWRDWIGLSDGSSYVWQVPDRDEAGFQALGELTGQGIGLAASALGRSTDHILSFFRALRVELGFYVGCLNLHAALTGRGEPTVLPDPTPAGRPVFETRGLYDASLSLGLEGRAVGNDIAADGKPLVVVTGANRGGKSTFLRSVGQAHVLMAAGMFVPAESFRADVRDGIFSHFKREEDVELRSGKLDEELARMSAIVDAIRPHGLVLLNESFGSTNEREGSEIGRQIVRALLESGVKVFCVTHLYDLAHGFDREPPAPTLFLRAGRLPDGTRTFRLEEGEPLPTSFGQDVYQRVFGPAGGQSAPARSGALRSE
jgi:hypothetical protein